MYNRFKKKENNVLLKRFGTDLLEKGEVITLREIRTTSDYISNHKYIFRNDDNLEYVWKKVEAHSKGKYVYFVPDKSHELSSGDILTYLGTCHGFGLQRNPFTINPREIGSLNWREVRTTLEMGYFKTEFWSRDLKTQKKYQSFLSRTKAPIKKDGYIIRPIYNSAGSNKSYKVRSNFDGKFMSFLTINGSIIYVPEDLVSSYVSHKENLFITSEGIDLVYINGRYSLSNIRVFLNDKEFSKKEFLDFLLNSSHRNFFDSKSEDFSQLVELMKSLPEKSTYLFNTTEMKLEGPFKRLIDWMKRFSSDENCKLIIEEDIIPLTWKNTIDLLKTKKSIS